MLGSAAVAGPTAYWYLTRGTGIVALVLLTVSVALGVANARRLRTETLPRFVVDAVHRNVSLLAMAFLLIHILTSVLDSFASISLVNAVIPFTGSYRPLWLGFGALAFDLLLAVMITSLLRRRFGYRSWRLTHWLAYASWPVALLHGLGTGTDTKTGWMLTIVGGCVILAIVAVVARAVAGWPSHPGARLSALLASALVPLGLLIWLPSGPLAAGWARKAGTPTTLLASARGSASSGPASSGSSGGSGSTSSGSASSPAAPFNAAAQGTISQSELGDGLAEVDISLSLSGQRLNTLAFRLQGEPLEEGGLQMTSSSVTLGPSSDPSQYRGQVTALEGSTINAQVSDSSGRRLVLVARLQLNPDGGTASGTVSATP
jgi:sulfoxide reductase heme-binding subunit YedZ